MKTEAIFENIAQRIIEELAQAQNQILIAVAWFTNTEILNLLLRKVQQGIAVHILLSDSSINRKKDQYFAQFNQKNSFCHYVGDDNKDLMHNKFCVIDEDVVINGSYNWSVKAESNHENIVITRGDETLTCQFIKQFQWIRKQYVRTEQQSYTLPINKIIKRLEILKNYVILEDDEDIARETGKLQIYASHEKINAIVEAVQSHAFSQALQLIDEFVKSSQQLIVIDDVEILALKLEIRYLEHQLNAYDNEKSELEHVLLQFRHRHTQELGKLILLLLKLQKLYHQNNPEEYAQAEKDEQEYKQQFEQEQQQQFFDLSQEEQQDLKQMFRKASQICHPDKVTEELKDAAHEVFIRLKQAYDENDITVVREILTELKSGRFHFTTRSETINQKEKLKAAISQLRHKIQQLELAIFTIKESTEYQTIAKIDDWDAYFTELKEQLRSEIDVLTKEVMG